MRYVLKSRVPRISFTYVRCSVRLSVPCTGTTVPSPPYSSSLPDFVVFHPHIFLSFYCAVCSHLWTGLSPWLIQMCMPKRILFSRHKYAAEVLQWQHTGGGIWKIYAGKFIGGITHRVGIKFIYHTHRQRKPKMFAQIHLIIVHTYVVQCARYTIYTAGR